VGYHLFNDFISSDNYVDCFNKITLGVAGTQWDNKKYMNMKHLNAAADDALIAG